MTYFWECGHYEDHVVDASMAEIKVQNEHCCHQRCNLNTPGLMHLLCGDQPPQIFCGKLFFQLKGSAMVAEQCQQMGRKDHSLNTMMTLSVWVQELGKFCAQKESQHQQDLAH